MTKAKVTFHANERINERATLTSDEILELLKNDLYTPLGFDKKKKNVVHKLIYHFEKDSFYVVCQDFNNEEIITILHGKQLRNWFVDLSTYQALKIKVINFIIDKGKKPKLLTSDIDLLNNYYVYSKYPLIKEYLILSKISLKENKKENIKAEDKKLSILLKSKKIGEDNIELLKNTDPKISNINKEESKNNTYLSPNMERIKEVINNSKEFSFISEEDDFIIVSVNDVAESENGHENLRVKLNNGNFAKIQKSSAMQIYQDRKEMNILLEYFYQNISKCISSKKEVEKFLNKHGYKGLNKRKLAEDMYYYYLKN